MIIEGVFFVVEECRKMTKEEFVDNFIDVFWLNRPRKERKKMLNDAYALINPPSIVEKSK
jgi:hypothetical protein